MLRPRVSWLFRGVAALVASLAFGACRNGPTSPGDDSDAAQIQLDPASATAASLGEVIQFTARVLDKNGNQLSAVPLTWTSSDTSVLVSEGNGRFRARSNGAAQVSVRLAKNDRVPKQSAQVVVQQVPARIQLSADTLLLYAIGQTAALEAHVVDALGNELTGTIVRVWQSTNPAVATVDDSGTVMSTGDGEVVISLQVGLLTESVFTRVSSTVRIAGCVSSADAAGDTCRSLLLSVRAAR